MSVNQCLFCKIRVGSRSPPPQPPITKAVSGTGDEIEVKIEEEEEQQDCDQDILIDPFLAQKRKDILELDLSEHLHSIFIVRKVLDISSEVCEKYLQSQDGNLHPKSWFSVCSECDDIVRKCFVLERKLQRIQKQLEEEKGKLKALICESGKKPGDELVSSNSYICNEIRKRVFKKETLGETIDSPRCHESNVRSPVAPRRRPRRRRRLGMTQRKRKGVRGKARAYGVKAEQPTDSVEHFSPPDLSVNADEAETMEYEVEAKPDVGTVSAQSSNSDNDMKQTARKISVVKDTADGKNLPQRKTRNSKSFKAENEVSSDLEDLNNEPDFPHSPEHTADSADVDWVPSDSDLKPIRTKESKVARRKSRKIVKRRKKLEIPEGKVLGLFTCQDCPAHFHWNRKYLVHRRLHESGDAGLTCPICGWFVRKKHIQGHCILKHPQERKRFQEELEKILPKKKHKWAPRKTWYGRRRLPFYCEYCPMIYTSASNLNRHVNSCHPDHVVHQCSFCSDNFMSKQILQLHIEIKHPSESTDPAGGSKLVDGTETNNEEVVPCLHCSETFTSVLDRDYHIAKSHLNILRTCKICGFQGTKDYTLGKHLQIKHKMHNHICPFCSRMYTAQSLLDMHLKANHSEEIGVQPIKCEQCPKTFMTEVSLKNHIDAVHKKIKEHVCEFCGKAFADKGYLKKHTLLHTETREKQYKAGPFFCKFCDAKFNVRQGLYYHMKNLHSDKYVYRCGKCGKGYEFRNTLVQHELKCTKVGGPKVPVTPRKTTSGEVMNNLG